MKRTRKGFTLVELLIVVAILATLTAAMTMSVTGSTAKAKAATIASNVDTCRRAATLYYASNMENASTLANATTSTVIEEYVKAWKDFNSGGKITYAPDDATTGTGFDSTTGKPAWNITVDFHEDADVEAIKAELAKIPGYGSYGATKDDPDDTNSSDGTDQIPDPENTRVKTGKFKVVLFDGTITSETVTVTP